MSEDKKSRKPAGRRNFLVGLLTGAGATAAISAAPHAAATKEKAAEAPPSAPVLYSRTEDTQRYYRSLYR